MINPLNVIVLACLFFLSTTVYSQVSHSSDELLARGKYLADIAGCKSCHTTEKGDDFGGGKITKSRVGRFYSPNISSDKSQGIGRWSLGDFSQALTQGVSPSGEHYYPVFPYSSYQNLTPQDVEALYRYLLTTKPSQTPSQTHDIDFPYSVKSLLSIWKWLYMEEGTMPKKPYDKQLEEGRYVLYAVGHCDQCHSPRSALGGIVAEERLNGGYYNGSESYAPSLLPSKGALKDWSVDDLETYLLLGEAPNGDYAGGAMVDVIDHVTSYLTNDDIRQLTEFLISQ
jgi:mono/diheme cytochrome c family protein